MDELVASGGYVAVGPFESDASEQLDMTSLASGGFLFSWVEDFGGAMNLRAYFLDASGAAGAGSFILNDETTTSIANPSVVGLSSGGFIATWEDSSKGVIVRMFDDTGAATTPPIVLDDGPPLGRYQQPSVAALADGSFVVTFTIGNDGNADAIRAQLFDSAGTRVGTEFNVNSATAGSQVYSQTVALDDGGFVVSWADTWAGTVAAQFYKADGSPVGGQLSLAPNSGGVFDIVKLASGNLVVAWSGADGEINSQIYSASGTKVGGEFQVNNPTADMEILPEIAPLSSGGFVVTWRSPTNVSPNFFQNGDIRAQVFDASGVKVGDEILASTGDLGQSEPHVVSFGHDDFMIAYTEFDQFGGYGIDVRSFYSAIQGTEGADVLNGSSDRDYIYGNGGNDTLNGGDGDAWDYLSGGAGNDTLNGGTGFSVLDGGAGDDQLYLGTNSAPFSPLYQYARGGTGADTIHGSDGWDEIYSDVGQDIEEGYFSFDPYIPQFYSPPILDRGSEVDTIFAGGGSDLVSIGYGDSADGGTNTDHGDKLILSLAIAPTGITADFTGMPTLLIGGGTITGFEGIAYLEGSEFNDVFTFDASPISPGVTTEVSTLGGDDHVIAGYYTSNIWGGDGNDVLDGSRSQYLRYISGGNGNDTIVGGWAGAQLEGGAGDDVVTGGSGLDRLYGGAGNDMLTGGGDSDVLNGGDGADTLKGGTGDDTYEIDAFDIIIENVGEGTDTVSTVSSYALGANLENLTLTGTAAADGTGNGQANVLIGNSAANVLVGLSGDDILSGNDGNDILDGGDGNDTLYGGLGTDTATYALAGAGIALSLALPGAMQNTGGSGTDRISSIENLVGSAFNDTLTGSLANNIIEGGSGNDVIDGGTGIDTLKGGAGDDTYFVDNAGDQTIEASGEGKDRVAASITWTLGANVEDLTLTGAAAIDGSGNELANIITGNSAANHLSGGGDNDTIDGGAGADTMAGGTGNDTFVVDNVGDVVTENAGEGRDQVNSLVTFTLGANLEDLMLTGTSAINGTGNTLANIVTGNDAANQLAGGGDNDTLIGNGGNDRLDGGSGMDNMVGGLGNDLYFVDNASDQAIELAGEGLDQVVATVSFTLGANVEYLVLGGTAGISGTGNELDNTITGNAGNNLLSGMDGSDTLFGKDGNDVIDGGLGADKMYGGLGDDVFTIDNIGDVVGENAGEGNDTINSSITTTIAINVETLNLTGTAAINGFGNLGNETINGNAAANVLTGNAGSDVLNGFDGNDRLDGGSGADTLAGGTGNDTYFVDNAGDTVIENGGEGANDLVNSYVSWTLGANLEHLTLQGSAAIDGTGNSVGNELRGNNGDNVLSGMDGNDILYGFAGNDTLLGGNGNDWLFGYGDADTLTGGAGSDSFWFATAIDSRPASYDTITDFSSAEGDKINLSKLDANTIQANDQAFAFIGTSAFTHSAGELRYEQLSGATYVYGDTNGDGTADFMVKLDGLQNLTSADFVL
jgi:serralysin